MNHDADIQQFVDNYVLPAFKAAIELLSKSESPEDLEIVEELKQFI